MSKAKTVSLGNTGVTFEEAALVDTDFLFLEIQIEGIQKLQPIVDAYGGNITEIAWASCDADNSNLVVKADIPLNERMAFFDAVKINDWFVSITGKVDVVSVEVIPKNASRASERRIQELGL